MSKARLFVRASYALLGRDTEVEPVLLFVKQAEAIIEDLNEKVYRVLKQHRNGDLNGPIKEQLCGDLQSLHDRAVFHLERVASYRGPVAEAEKLL